jgi:tRNA(Ile)-lysidine synthase
VLPLDPRLNIRQRHLLGLSGGRDSVALLHTLLEAGADKLVLCHLNHQLRGLFSAHDASFVRELAEKHDLPFEIARHNIQRRAEEEGVSLEVAARRSRHELFALCAKKHRCTRVLLAHHADDNAETVLLNLLRGSSGLKGMRFESELTAAGKTLTLVRPLLGVRRSEIDTYLTARKLPYRDDASNLEPFTARNRLRLEALPLLAKIMDRDVTPAINRAAEASEEDREALDGLIEVLDLVDPQERLFLPKLRKLPDPLQRRALFLYLLDSGIGDLSRDLITRCQALLDPASPAKVNLPGDLHLRRRAGRLFVE